MHQGDPLGPRELPRLDESRRILRFAEPDSPRGNERPPDPLEPSPEPRCPEVRCEEPRVVRGAFAEEERRGSSRQHCPCPRRTRQGPSPGWRTEGCVRRVLRWLEGGCHLPRDERENFFLSSFKFFPSHGKQAAFREVLGLEKANLCPPVPMSAGFYSNVDNGRLCTVTRTEFVDFLSKRFRGSTFTVCPNLFGETGLSHAHHRKGQSTCRC